MERCLLKGTSLFLFVFVAGVYVFYILLFDSCVKNVNIN